MRSKISVFILVMLFFVSLISFAQPPIAIENETDQTETEKDPEYESALRRFEIITLTSLPFTAVHSFLAVRGVEMVRQKKFAPDLNDANFRAIGISAVSISIVIGIWDWHKTRGKDRNEPLIPKQSLRDRNDQNSTFVLDLFTIRF